MSVHAVEVGVGDRDVGGVAGGAARRVDPAHGLERRGQVAPERRLGGQRLADLVLGRERELLERRVLEPRELVAVERRALAQLGDAAGEVGHPSYSIPASASAASLEPDRALVLLAQVAEQPGGARQQRDRLQRVRGQPEVEHRRGDRARHVEREHAAVDLGHGGLDRAHERDMLAGHAELVGQREQARGARVAVLVQRMAEAGQRPALLAVLAHELDRVGAGGERLGQHRARVLGGAEDHRAAARAARPPPRPAATRARRRASCARPARSARARARRSPPGRRRSCAARARRARGPSAAGRTSRSATAAPSAPR